MLEGEDKGAQALMTEFIAQLIDPVAGICALYACQLKPSDDAPSHELVRLFEKTMYERMQEAEKSG